jgi:hypothetical protein
MNNKNYGILNLRFIDAIIEKKRYEMFKIFKKKISNVSINSFLDVGTTEESLLSSSNFFVKKFESIKVKKSISNQNIEKKNFNYFIKKSITEKLSIDEINKFKSDLVISSATIEHVGHFKNQKKMIENIINLTNKYFFVTTPYRFYPIDFHTKIPFIHMLPKLIHRKILNILNLKDFAKEENLNLLDISLVKKIIEELNTKGFRIEILKIKLFGMISNLIIFGERIK